MSDDELPPAVAKAANSAMIISAETIVPRLRLYIARSTPNSTRAEHNLRSALEDLGDIGRCMVLEIVDVFTNPKRAVADGIIVTPTLIGICDKMRVTMMGDLTDSGKLNLLLTSLRNLKE